MSEQDTREQLEADMQNLNGYPTLCKSLANYVAGLLIAKSDEAYKRGYDDGLHANTKAAFAAAKQAFGVEGDTREQLEVDLNNLCLDCLGLGWNAANDLKKAIRKLLYRQAAITKWECSQDAVVWVGAPFNRGYGWRDVRELLDKIAELRAERDILEARLAGKPECEICDRATMLVEIEGLTAERDKWRARAEQVQESYLDAKDSRDNLQEAIDAMGNGQFYAMYKAKCEECEEAVSFAKRLENAVNDGQPVTLFGVDYEKSNKKLLAEHERLTKKLKRLRRRLSKLRKERDYLQKVVRTQADSFKKLEIELGKQ